MEHLLTLSIPLPDHFSFQECLWFLDRGYDDCLYHLQDGKVSKPFVLGNGDVLLIEIADGADALQVKTFGATDLGIEELARETRFFVRSWFDMDRDIAPFYHLLKQHDILRFMPDRYAGFRLIGIHSLLEALCWCVIGQQINLSFAHRLKRRLVTTYGTPLVANAHTYHRFPSAETLAALHREDLLELQFSRQKADYVIGIAQRMSAGELSQSQLECLPSFEARRQALMDIRGVGAWTANYVLMKTFGEMQCITYGDAGLNKALKDLAGIGPKPKPAEVDAFFAPFEGWQSYLVVYLWRSLS